MSHGRRSGPDTGDSPGEIRPAASDFLAFQSDAASIMMRRNIVAQPAVMLGGFFRRPRFGVLDPALGQGIAEYLVN